MDRHTDGVFRANHTIASLVPLKYERNDSSPLAYIDGRRGSRVADSGANSHFRMKSCVVQGAKTNRIKAVLLGLVSNALRCAFRQRLVFRLDSSTFARRLQFPAGGARASECGPLGRRASAGYGATLLFPPAARGSSRRSRYTAWRARTDRQ